MGLKIASKSILSTFHFLFDNFTSARKQICYTLHLSRKIFHWFLFLNQLLFHFILYSFLQNTGDSRTLVSRFSSSVLFKPFQPHFSLISLFWVTSALHVIQHNSHHSLLILQIHQQCFIPSFLAHFLWAMILGGWDLEIQIPPWHFHLND